MDGDLADSPDTVVELEVYDQHWITDEEVCSRSPGCMNMRRHAVPLQLHRDYRLAR